MTYLMDKQSVAKHCDISVDSVDAWVRAGRIPPGVMVGGKKMWKRATVKNHLNAIFGGPASEADLAARVRHATRQRVNAR